jgi:hypothetical protein
MPSFTFKLKDNVTFNPVYQISPCVTLKYNDGGYVYKFNGIYYKSNFELDAFGTPYNYASFTVSHDEGTPVHGVFSYMIDSGANNLEMEYYNKPI